MEGRRGEMESELDNEMAEKKESDPLEEDTEDTESKSTPWEGDAEDTKGEVEEEQHSLVSSSEVGELFHLLLIFNIRTHI